MPKISIIIPSFNEGKNVVTITERICLALKNHTADYEIWFIDDSRDNTPDLLKTLSETLSHVHYIHRKNGRGLGTAVVEGFQKASGDILIVMDCDLQHPPELLPQLIQSLEKNDIVIPTRFKNGGSDGGLNSFRKLVSWTARKIGQFAIKKFRAISDCTGGFFGLHRSVISNVKLNPSSWKILMEVLVKGKYKTVDEIPYEFLARDSGESKMSSKEQLNYLWHIVKLVAVSPEDRRFYLFCLVGVLGLLVNLILFKLFLIFHFHPLLASALASLIGLLHNFLWHDNFTWKEFRHTEKLKRLLQFPKFIVVSLIGIGITVCVVKIFMMMHWNLTLGQLTGIGIATFWNYFSNKKWTWGNQSDGN